MVDGPRQPFGEVDKSEPKCYNSGVSGRRNIFLRGERMEVNHLLEINQRVNAGQERNPRGILKEGRVKGGVGIWENPGNCLRLLTLSLLLLLLVAGCRREDRSRTTSNIRPAPHFSKMTRDAGEVWAHT